MARKKQGLPFGIGCLAFFLLFGSLAGISCALLYFMHRTGTAFPSIPKEIWTALESLGRKNLYLAFASAVALFPTAIGLFARKLWAYIVYTMMNGMNIGIGGAQIFLHQNWLAIPGMLINILILVYMFLPDVRKVFK